MSLIVQKFGGSSLSDNAKLLRVAHIIQKTRAEGCDVIAVLSARGDETDRLLAAAQSVRLQPDARELDMLLATGEQASVALCAMALGSLGVPAVSLCAWQVPILSDGVHTDARIMRIGHERIETELRAHRVVLVAGFQAVDETGDVTTLGRGGSDTSAVALAAAFHADRCQIFTDVDGIYTTDPRRCPAAQRLENITFAQMYHLASEGAQVLHARSVALAQRAGVEIEVRSCSAGSVGSRVTAQADARDIAGVTVRADGEDAVITAVGNALPSESVERQAADALTRAEIPLRGMQEGEGSFSLAVPAQDADAALCAVHGALFPPQAEQL